MPPTISYANRIPSYSKGLPHDDLGEVDLNAYNACLQALSSGQWATRFVRRTAPRNELILEISEQRAEPLRSAWEKPPMARCWSQSMEPPLPMFPRQSMSELKQVLQTQCSRATPIGSIFCSYSHQDETVVLRVERACRALGIDYLRDRVSLKSGEKWNDALLTLISQADLFQLFWSGFAAASPFVYKEWRQAYSLHRDAARFIRPVFWAQPMPAPPGELASLHFAYAPELLE